MIAAVFWAIVFLVIAGIWLCRRWAAGQERIYDGWRADQGLQPVDAVFPKTAWKAHIAKAWKSEFGGERIFREELGKWPTVRKAEGKPNTYRIEARYPSPRSMKRAKLWAAIAAVGFFLWLSGRLAQPGYGDNGQWFQQGAGPLIGGALGGMISYPVFRALFRATLWRIGRPMKMTIEGARIEWTGDEQAKKWWQWNPKAVVLPAETPRFRVIPHRKAAEELRKNQERQQRRKKPLPMYYQQCSEVLIVSGPSLARWQQVAEIAKDEHSERGGMLQQAIDYVFRAATGALEQPGHGRVEADFEE